MTDTRVEKLPSVDHGDLPRPATSPFAHTPGPWRADFGEDRGYDCMTDAWHISGLVGGGWPAPIATIDLSHYGQSRRTKDIPEISKRHAEADARLISAAPDLLRAAKVTAAFHRGVIAALTIAIERGGNRFNSSDMLKAFTDHNETDLIAAIEKAEGRL